MKTQLTVIWNRIKAFVIAAGAVIAAALAFFVWWKVEQKDVAKVDAKVSADQKKIQGLSQDEANNNTVNQAEENKRIALEQQLEKVTNDQPDQDTILRIINTPDDKQ